MEINKEKTIQYWNEGINFLKEKEYEKAIEAFSKAITGFFSIVNIVGAIVGGISLIVGLFGIANIMFVTVRERTSVIGLKKAIGAKKSSILFEFLLEATILCFMGGLVGLFFVYLVTVVLSTPLC